MVGRQIEKEDELKSGGVRIGTNPRMKTTGYQKKSYTPKRQK
jgi:hypothetical protein